MTAENIDAALKSFFSREAEANAPGGPGADISELIEITAIEHGIDSAVLTEAVLDAGIMRAN